MASLSQLINAELRMPAAEVQDLVKRGFASSVVIFLQAHGFREAGEVRNDDGTTSPTFLRQTHFPHIHIPVHPGDDLDDVLSAIYDAGYIDGGDRIATKWQSFQDAVKRPRRPSET